MKNYRPMKTFIPLMALLIFLSFNSLMLNAQGLAGVVNQQQEAAPVTWTQKVEKISDGEYQLVFTATAAPRWHFYSQYSEGTMPMAFYFDDVKGYELKGKVLETPKPKEEYDDALGGLTKYWDGTATFTQKVLVRSSEAANVHGSIEYQACIEGACTMLTHNFSFDLPGTGRAAQADKTAKLPNKESKPVQAQERGVPAAETSEAAAAADEERPESVVESSAGSTEEASEPAMGSYTDLIWEPIIEELSAYHSGKSFADKSFWLIFILGFVGGLVALMTPCVWPMIPMTVSFFIKKADKAAGKRDAIIYGISIVVIYVSLGLGVTAIFGADALNDLATSAIFNILFFLLLLVFAISFFGAFEIQLPTRWSNKMDKKADSASGLIAIFFMAFTLVLVSFSCTGPIIGTLLVQAVTKGMWGPAIGMTGFSLALALPFTLFAIFPGWMNSMPKSGGWLNSVKVVLGFIELALALKFLSVADMAYHWHILDREVFLALWIVIFALLGVYLLGKIMFPHDSKVERIGIFRFFLAMISLSFALYMVPGLWGAPLKAISAFSPPMNTQDFNLYKGSVEAKFYNYDDGMAYAKKHRLPVMVDFTGYGCVNCRNMELAVWSDPAVKELLEDKYVLISLYVDDKKPLPKEMQRKSKLTGNKLRSYGNLWSELEIGKFGTSTQPYYYLLDNEGKPLAGPKSYDLNVKDYREWLLSGLQEYGQRKNR